MQASQRCFHGGMSHVHEDPSSLDGSKRAEGILPHVEDLVSGHEKSEVLLLQVVEPVPTTIYAADPVPPLDPRLIDRAINDARAYLERIQARLRRKEIQAHVHVSIGPVVGTIVDFAAREKADLIALASHGRSGLPAFFYGSVAARRAAPNGSAPSDHTIGEVSRNWCQEVSPAVAELHASKDRESEKTYRLMQRGVRPLDRQIVT